MLNKLFGLAENASDHGLMIDHMLEVVHWFMLALFVGWTAFFILTLVKFRRSKNPKANYTGTKSKFSTHAEVGVVIVEAILLLGLALPLWTQRVNAFPTADQNPVNIRVVGQQFLFSIHYPGADNTFGRTSPEFVTDQNRVGLDPSDEAAQDDIVALNSFHVPTGRPTVMQLSSKDVIHNFAVYTMRVAQDMIPGSEIPMWFTPVRTGEWEVICGQLCGNGHYSMKAVMTVEGPAEFDAWLANQRPLVESL